MKHFLFSLICLALIAPASAIAQTNVAKAFNKLIENKTAEISETHQRENDPQTGEMESMADVYDFSIPSELMNLIKDIEKAFKKDSEKAYGYYSGRNAKRDDVLVASGPKSNVGIVMHKNSNYTYALFVDMKRPEHNHRYAYGFSYCEEGKNIRGRLVITYATTLKYRQSNQIPKTIFNLGQRKWFDDFMSKITSLEYMEGNDADDAPILIPTLKDIYNLSESCDSSITTKEREIAISILTQKQENEFYQNQTVQKLLKESINNIKKR